MADGNKIELPDRTKAAGTENSASSCGGSGDGGCSTTNKPPNPKMTNDDSTPKPCRRCKNNDGVISMRGQPTCGECFVPFIKLKAVKRLNTLHRDLAEARGTKAPQQARYLCGLSFGPSSAVLLSMLDDNIRYLVDKGKGGIAYGVTAVHVDTSLDADARVAAQRLLEQYRARFPALAFECVGVEDAVDVRGVNWAALGLGGAPPAGAARMQHVARALAALPSVSARMDVLRLLVRHVLVGRAVQDGADALLLGTSMTALAELTFSEVAKGRGVAVPWVTQDGAYPVPAYGGDGDGAAAAAAAALPVYHVLRDVFRGEVLTYAELPVPSLVPLVPGLADGRQTGRAVVVSHKTLSIEEVMGRFFDEAEAENASVIANVVRTTARLGRLEEGADGRMCEICGLAMDGEGDERWRGEIGLEEAKGGEGLCYGCQRSLTT